MRWTGRSSGWYLQIRPARLEAFSALTNPPHHAENAPGRPPHLEGADWSVRVLRFLNRHVRDARRSVK
jgi:hypothetical protein